MSTPELVKKFSKFSDKIYVTSDNPRFEDPKSIIDDIIPGISCVIAKIPFKLAGL